jgi:hypothetical protein
MRQFLLRSPKYDACSKREGSCQPTAQVELAEAKQYNFALELVLVIRVASSLCNFQVSLADKESGNRCQGRYTIT